MKTRFNTGDTIFNKTLDTNVEAIMCNELSEISSWEIISIYNPQDDQNNKFNDGFSDDDENQYVLRNDKDEIIQVREGEVDTDYLLISETDQVIDSNNTYNEDVQDYQNAAFSN